MASSPARPDIHDVDYETCGEPTVLGPRARLVFDVDDDTVADWRCPCCDADAFVDLGRHAPMYAQCTSQDCPVKLFHVLRRGGGGE